MKTSKCRVAHETNAYQRKQDQPEDSAAVEEARETLERIDILAGRMMDGEVFTERGRIDGCTMHYSLEKSDYIEDPSYSHIESLLANNNDFKDAVIKLRIIMREACREEAALYLNADLEALRNMADSDGDGA